MRLGRRWCCTPRREYGVRAVGVTLSPEQAEFARERIARAGLADRVEIRLQDYREVVDGPYDAIASVGMAEHVGIAQLEVYAAACTGCSRPAAGCCTTPSRARPEPSASRRSPASFIDRYVFPDGELEPWARRSPRWTGRGSRSATWRTSASTTR